MRGCLVSAQAAFVQSCRGWVGGLGCVGGIIVRKGDIVMYVPRELGFIGVDCGRTGLTAAGGTLRGKGQTGPHQKRPV